MIIKKLLLTTFLLLASQASFAGITQHETTNCDLGCNTLENAVYVIGVEINTDQDSWNNGDIVLIKYTHINTISAVIFTGTWNFLDVENPNHPGYEESDEGFFSGVLNGLWDAIAGFLLDYYDANGYAINNPPSTSVTVESVPYNGPSPYGDDDGEDEEDDSSNYDDDEDSFGPDDDEYEDDGDCGCWVEVEEL